MRTANISRLNLQPDRALGRQRAPLFEVRRSSIHELGVFSMKRIAKGTRVIEYVGERLSSAELDARYHDDTQESRHTFVFHIGADRYIDAARGGNDSRFINHSCDPNCETYLSRGRIFLRAIKNIEPGVELTYDYSLEIEDEPLLSWESVYACRCEAARCRGTMLDRPPESGKRTRPRNKK